MNIVFLFLLISFMLVGTKKSHADSSSHLPSPISTFSGKVSQATGSLYQLEKETCAFDVYEQTTSSLKGSIHIFKNGTQVYVQFLNMEKNNLYVLEKVAGWEYGYDLLMEGNIKNHWHHLIKFNDNQILLKLSFLSEKSNEVFNRDLQHYNLTCSLNLQNN